MDHLKKKSFKMFCSYRYPWANLFIVSGQGNAEIIEI